MTLEGDGPKLPIKAIYRRGKEVVKINSAGTGTNAVPRCVMHMRANDYAATVAEVHNERNGKLYAVVKRTVDGNVHILYENKYREGE